MLVNSIIFISNNFWTLYKFRFEIIQHLSRKGYDIHLIGEMDGYEAKLSPLNVKCHNVSFKGREINLFNEIKSIYKLSKIIRKINPLIVFNFTIKPNIYSGLVCRYNKIRYVSMITGLGFFFNNSKTILKSMIKYLLKQSLQSSSIIWFTNKSDHEYFIKNKILNKQNTDIIPGAGVKNNDTKFNNIFDKKEITFLMISRLLNEKGISEYLQAAKYFYKYNKYKFLLVGKYENDRHHIKRYLLDNSIRDTYIEYIDFTDDIDELYSRASCIVLPSYREGLSTILLEAAVRKLPIITTDVPGCNDVIIDDKYGFLCEAASAQSLVDTMKLFIKSSKEELSSKVNKTYSHVTTNFSIDMILKKYDKLLDHD